MRYIKFICLFYIISLFTAASLAVAAEAKLQAIDEARILSAEQSLFIGQYHEKLLETYDIDYRVLTNAEDNDINSFTNKQFAALQVGSLSKTGRGLLLVINAKQNLVRLEVSKGLESVYTDAFISYIEHKQMIPFFKANQVANGVLATSELVFARAADAVAGKSFDPGVTTGSAGGGAVNKAQIGSGAEAKSTKELAQAGTEQSPEEVVAAYLAAMKDRNSNPDLPIYSEATKEMQKKWVVTAGQMDMLSRTYEKCASGNKDHVIGPTHAVVRYYAADRSCSPFFLVKENGEWKLDLTMMQKAIRFNHLNQWHFDMSVRHDYEFAFTDWSFDKNGYSIVKKKPRWGMSWDTVNNPFSQKPFTVITHVGKGTFAETAGLRPGDIITKWDNEEMPVKATIIRLIDEADENVPFTIIIQRGDQLYTIAGESPPRN